MLNQGQIDSSLVPLNSSFMSLLSFFSAAQKYFIELTQQYFQTCFDTLDDEESDFEEMGEIEVIRGREEFAEQSVAINIAAEADGKVIASDANCDVGPETDSDNDIESEDDFESAENIRCASNLYGRFNNTAKSPSPTLSHITILAYMQDRQIYSFFTRPENKDRFVDDCQVPSVKRIFLI
jgi:hypothetical protein